jgi:hypothetical protein
MKLLLDNVSNKHLEWLRKMAKALNFTITEIEQGSNESQKDQLLEESETEYLLSSQANKEHLEQSLKQAEEGKTTSVDINNLWK